MVVHPNGRIIKVSISKLTISAWSNHRAKTDGALWSSATESSGNGNSRNGINASNDNSNNNDTGKENQLQPQMDR